DHGPEHPGVRQQGAVVGDQAEGERQEPVAGQDRHRLAEDLVAGRPPTAEVVVVHRGKVVVDQRVGVDTLERTRRRHHALPGAADRLGAGDDEDRAQTLTAREHAVAHRPVDRRGRHVLRGQRAFEGTIDRGAALRQIAGQIELGHRSSSGSIVKGSLLRRPPSSLSRSSTRRSASSRYLAQWRASATPSSKALSESSSGRVPDSSWPTICSSRVRQSSNLRSIILLLRLDHRAVEPSLVQPDAYRVAGRHLARAAHDLAGRRPRQAVAAPEHGQRRQPVELAGGDPRPLLRPVERPPAGGPEPPPGVGARRSATKSAIVKSTSWPTPEITGAFEATIARATTSSLKAQRSSSEPPPRPTMITSTSPSAFRSATPSAISRAAPSPWTRTGRMTMWRSRKRRPITRSMSRRTAPVGEVTMPTFRGNCGSGRLRPASPMPAAGSGAAGADTVETRRSAMLSDPVRRGGSPGRGPGSPTAGAAGRARPGRVDLVARQRRPSRAELAAGRGQRVPEEHRDRHGPDAARHGRDGPRALARGVEIDVAHELARLETVDPDVDHPRPLLHHGARDYAGPARRHAEHVGAAGVGGEVTGAGVTHGDGGVPREQELGQRLADDP